MGKWLTWKNLLCFTLCFTSFDELGRTHKAIAERESHIHLWVVWLLRTHNWNWFLNLTVSGASVSMKLEIWWGQWWGVCGLNAKWLSFIYFKGQHDLVHFTIYQPWGKTVESATEHEGWEVEHFTVLQSKYHCGSFCLFDLGGNFICD